MKRCKTQTMCQEKRPQIGQTHRFENSRKLTATQKRSAKLCGNMQNMTKRMMQKKRLMTHYDYKLHGSQT